MVFSQVKTTEFGCPLKVSVIRRSSNEIPSETDAVDTFAGPLDFIDCYYLVSLRGHR